MENALKYFTKESPIEKLSKKEFNEVTLVKTLSEIEVAFERDDLLVDCRSGRT
jgi:hypothetical protein